MDDLMLGLLFLSVSVGVPVSALVIAAIRAWRTGVVAALPLVLGALTFVLLAPVGCGGTHSIPGTHDCWTLTGLGASVRSSDDIARWVPLDPSLIPFGLLAVGAGMAMVVVAYVTRRVWRTRSDHGA